MLKELKSVPEVAVPELAPKPTDIFFADAVLNRTVTSALFSSLVVLLSTDNDGSGSSSEMVRTPVASLMLALDGLARVTITVSSISSKLSATTEIGITFDVSLGLKVSGVVDTAV